MCEEMQDDMKVKIQHAFQCLVAQGLPKSRAIERAWHDAVNTRTKILFHVLTQVCAIPNHLETATVGNTIIARVFFFCAAMCPRLVIKTAGVRQKPAERKTESRQTKRRQTKSRQSSDKRPSCYLRPKRREAFHWSCPARFCTLRTIILEKLAVQEYDKANKNDAQKTDKAQFKSQGTSCIFSRAMAIILADGLLHGVRQFGPNCPSDKANSRQRQLEKNKLRQKNKSTPSFAGEWLCTHCSIACLPASGRQARETPQVIQSKRLE